MHVPLDDRVRRWLDQAAGDFAIARRVLDDLPHQACFHAQQAAKKSVEAYLTRLSGDALPTHELDRLVEARSRLGADLPADVRDEARSLDTYYISTRYPDALGFADAALAYQKRDAATAIASAERVAAWCDDGIARLRLADPDPP